MVTTAGVAAWEELGTWGGCCHPSVSIKLQSFTPPPRSYFLLLLPFSLLLVYSATAFASSSSSPFFHLLLPVDVSVSHLLLLLLFFLRRIFSHPRSSLSLPLPQTSSTPCSCNNLGNLTSLSLSLCDSPLLPERPLLPRPIPPATANISPQISSVAKKNPQQTKTTTGASYKMSLAEGIPLARLLLNSTFRTPSAKIANATKWPVWIRAP